MTRGSRLVVGEWIAKNGRFQNVRRTDDGLAELRSNGMKLFVAGISYKTAPVEVREKLSVRPGLLPCQGCRAKLGAGLDEIVLLSTCNRVEVHGTTPKVNGNTEITGQVKNAYQSAQTAKLTGRVMNRLFQTALQTAKEVRTQTSIGR